MKYSASITFSVFTAIVPVKMQKIDYLCDSAGHRCGRHIKLFKTQFTGTYSTVCRLLNQHKILRQILFLKIYDPP